MQERGAVASLTRARRRTGLLLIVAAAVIVVDQLTKAWALSALADGPIDLIGSLRLFLTRNTAGAFGLGGAAVPFLAVAALVLVAVMASSGATTRSPVLAVAVGLVLGGAIGNLIDRLLRAPGLLRGAVVDFIDLQFWPVFNVADMAISCGCVLLVWAGWRSGSSRERGERAGMRTQVPAALGGERVDRAVAMLCDVTRSDAAALVAEGAVLLDGRAVPARSRRVAEGQWLEVAVPDERLAPPATAAAAPDPYVNVPVVAADEAVIVVDKPAGLVVHPGAGHDTGTMVQGLLARYPDLAGVGEADRPGIVHRLDAGTSGLLVVARTDDAYRSLVAQLAERSVERRYLALVWKAVEAESGLVDAPIGRAANDPTKMAVAVEGRPARTRYEVLERFTRPIDATLLECQLETGRTHQIRVHLAAIGHPVVGDGRYRGQRPSFPADRPFLHAYRLGFDHPVDGQRRRFESPLPPDLEALRDLLA